MTLEDGDVRARLLRAVSSVGQTDLTNVWAVPDPLHLTLARLDVGSEASVISHRCDLSIGTLTLALATAWPYGAIHWQVDRKLEP